MNDDFLYKRQEAPDPAFVAQMQSLLKLSEVPEKAKRKKGQSRFQWKALVAAVSLILVGLIFSYTPEIRIPIMNMIYGYPNEDVLLNAQETLDFELPVMPNGYYISSIRHTDLDIPHVIAHWLSYRGECRITFTVIANPQAPENTREFAADFLAANYDWIDVFVLREDVKAVWRLNSSYNHPNMMSLEWRVEGNDYSLETLESCLSRESLAAIAQSTLPDNP